MDWWASHSADSGSPQPLSTAQPDSGNPQPLSTAQHSASKEGGDLAKDQAGVES